jgi:hypothetical protein
VASDVVVEEVGAGGLDKVGRGDITPDTGVRILGGEVVSRNGSKPRAASAADPFNRNALGSSGRLC